MALPLLAWTPGAKLSTRIVASAMYAWARMTADGHTRDDNCVRSRGLVNLICHWFLNF